MVVIFSKEGQLANRLWNASFLLTNALENNYNLVHLYFDDYYPFYSERFESTKVPIEVVGKEYRWQAKCLQLAGGFLRKVFLKLDIRRLPFVEFIHHSAYEQDDLPYDLASHSFVQKAKTKVLLVSGWRLEDRDAFLKNQDLIRDLWTPNRNYLVAINRYVANIYREYELMVGVHVRRGDYKRFNNGVWHYSLEQYEAWIKQMAALPELAGKKIAFVVCTNELDVTFPDGENYKVFVDKKHFIEDIYILAKCNYIIGPPSTYSRWASFYGRVPLLQLTTADQVINLKKFQIDTTG
jgi:hypothetical protein